MKIFIKSLKKSLYLIIISSLLFSQSLAPVLVFAQEATQSSEIIQQDSILPSPTKAVEEQPIVSPSTSPTPEESLISTPSIAFPTEEPSLTPSITSSTTSTPSTVPTSTPAPVSDWQEVTDGATVTLENVTTGHTYIAPQNNKVTVKFNKLNTPGKLTVKEVRLTEEQIKQTGALSSIAYDISSDMPNGTFEYTLTLPTTKTDNIEVKASEDGQSFVTLGGVSAQTDILTITGLNHFTIFVVTGTITENICVTPPSGMTNWWTGDNHPNDITGGSNGTLFNDTTYVSGKVSQAFSFDGNGDYVQMPSAVGDFGSSAFTIDFWMYSNNSGGGDPTFIMGKNHADGGLGWDIRLSNNAIRVVGVNGWGFNITSDASATENTWHHIALSSTESTVTEPTVNLYIDGVLKGTSPRSAITSTSNPFRIGFTTNFQSPAFNGLIDEVEIFNRALTQEEIQSIYNAGSAGKCKTEGSTTSLEATAFTENENAVVINEFVFNPSSGNEWIELYNNGSSSVDLSGWKLEDGNSINDDLTLSGIIPPNGLLVFEHNSGWLNNDGDTITLKNSEEEEVSKVTYLKEASGTIVNGQATELNNTTSGQSIGRVVSLGGINWQVYSNPTKGWFNDAGGENTAPLLSDIDLNLDFNGINSNIGELDNPSNTPEGDNGLYFEKSGEGKILFTANLNLTNQNTVNVLQNLGNALEMSNGHIKFDSTTAQAMTDTGAKLFMYGLNDLGYSSAPNIIVSDDEGMTISRDDPNYPIEGSIVYSADNNGQIVFDASHFTQFDVEQDSNEPEITDISINPINENSYVKGIVTTSASVTDNVGVSSVDFSFYDYSGWSIDPEASCEGAQGENNLWSCPIDTTSLSDDSSYYLQVTAYDAAGNPVNDYFYDDSENDEIYVDNIPPSSVNVSDSGDQTANPGLTFSWPGADDYNGISYYQFWLSTATNESSALDLDPNSANKWINIGDVTSYTLTDTQAALLTAGNQYFAQVKAVDYAGNVATNDVSNWSDGITYDAGTIIIVKDSVPDDGQDFTFTRSFGNDFSLDDDNNNTLPNTVTFANVPSGQYTVTENEVGGWKLTGLTCQDSDNGSIINLTTRTATIDLDPGNIITCTFTNTKLGSINGMKFEDLNGNGVKEASDSGRLGWTVQLSGEASASATTGSDGSYTFNNLLPGTYRVCEAFDNAWAQKTPTSGYDCGNGLKGYTVNLSAGQNVTGKDFGNFKKVIIDIFKWKDLDADGELDKGELPFRGWDMRIEEAIKKLTSTPNSVEGQPPTMTEEIIYGGLRILPTNDNGKASFEVDHPGTYRITETSQDNFQRTYPGDSFFDIFVEFSGQMTSGETSITKDKNGTPLRFGNAPFQQLSGAKFVPTSGDGGSTTSIVVLGDSIISVSSGGGTSSVSLPGNTVITRSGGGTIDVSQLSAQAPTIASMTGFDSNTVVDGAMQWGIPDFGLEFKDANGNPKPITLNIFVGTSLNGQTLNVVRSSTGTSGWTSDGIEDPKTCTVTSGICTFRATKASYYATTHTTSTTTTSTSTPTSSTSSSNSGDGGGSVSAPVCSDTKPGSAPTLISATAGSNSVTLTWSQVIDPVSYYLVTYGSSSGAQTYGNPNVGGKGTTSYIVNGLSGRTTYYFRVRAGNGCMPGDYSNELSATPGGGFVNSLAAGFAPGVLGVTTEEATPSGKVKGESTSSSISPTQPKPTPQSQNIDHLPLYIKVAVALSILIIAGFGIFRVFI